MGNSTASTNVKTQALPLCTAFCQISGCPTVNMAESLSGETRQRQSPNILCAARRAVCTNAAEAEYTCRLSPQKWRQASALQKVARYCELGESAPVAGSMRKCETSLLRKCPP